ncbi:helix-turn-helix transcriptional regulator [Clostridium sp. WILCCON 0269]|uniref:Helix-turn-helix transcriptional regulator n=1 Tax=Candidatus Clostridium eludens TaxID=3381663 RepID=A0ABW8SG65_9CLOT
MKNRLKEIRMREYMMNPKEFARLIEVNPKTYYAWENGTSVPSMKEGLRAAKKLSKNLDEIWYLE